MDSHQPAAREAARLPTALSASAVRVERGRRGVWEVVFPCEHSSLRCDTLAEAQQVADYCAQRCSCDVVMFDAYHRVLRYELAEPGATRRGCPCAEGESRSFIDTDEDAAPHAGYRRAHEVEL